MNLASVVKLHLRDGRSFDVNRESLSLETASIQNQLTNDFPVFYFETGGTYTPLRAVRVRAEDVIGFENDLKL